MMTNRETMMTNREEEFMQLIACEMEAQGMSEPTIENIEKAKEAIHKRMLAILESSEQGHIVNIAENLWKLARQI